MEMNSSNPEKFFVDLKLLPPINPHASPTSHSQVNSRKPKTRALGKVVKPSAKQGLKLVEYDGRPTKANQAYNIQAQNLMVEEDAFLCPRECREFTSNGVMGGRGNIAFQNESTDGTDLNPRLFVPYITAMSFGIVSWASLPKIRDNIFTKNKVSRVARLSPFKRKMRCLGNWCFTFLSICLSLFISYFFLKGFKPHPSVLLFAPYQFYK
ncbi:uncharacterized protein LOC109008618 isoform X1 [Juglans regia]|uniref:Uncharacterized protein LOC109008618 isoform X1 n=1 Tax=Juglans regia TaxID=51240 RepID=A0A6P9EL24_JUGRE|nr:uncharacterized protein LOC109008618 isoform X1 [Juglans regia]